MVENADSLEVNIKEIKSSFIYFKEYLPKFLKLLYKAGHQYEAIVIYMVEIENLDINNVIFSIQMKKDMLDNRLNTFANIPIFDSISINTDIIITNLAEEFDFENDFKLWKSIWKNNKKKINKLLNKLPDNKYMHNFIKLIYLKDHLILTNDGIRKILSKLSSKIWPNQINYWKYQNQIESKYIDTLENFMTDDKNNLVHYFFCQYEYIDRLTIFNIDKYNNIRNFINSNPKILKNHKISHLHYDLPFLQADTGKFVKWNNYVNRIFAHYTPEQKEQLKYKNSQYIHYICGQDIITNYSVISPIMIQKLYQ
jgi:hypothetical protein